MRKGDIRMCARLLEQAGRQDVVREINKINRRLRVRKAFTFMTIAYIVVDVYSHKSQKEN